MRPARQIKIISSHLESFVSLRKHLEIVLDDINTIVEKGNLWLTGKNEGESFSEINQLLVLKMESFLNQLKSIAEDENEDIHANQLTDNESQANKPSPMDIMNRSCVSQFHMGTSYVQVDGPNDLHDTISTLKKSVERSEENYIRLCTKYEELGGVLDKTTKKLESLKEKYKVQRKSVHTINTNNADADIVNNKRFDEIMSELHTASNFIQSNADTFSEQLKSCKEQMTTGFNQKLNVIDLKLEEIKITNERTSFKVTEVEEKLTDIPKDIDTFNKQLTDVKSSLAKHDLFLNDHTEYIKTLEKKYEELSNKEVSGILPSTVFEESGPNADNCSNQMLFSADKTKEIHLFGSYETQVSKGGETDLHKHYSECIKNPDHVEFIPVEKFTLNDLPAAYRDEDLFKYIKATAELTVRVDVKAISSKRPQFWPMTTVPYPFYTMRGNTCLRTGSGLVSEVLFTYDQFTDSCPCEMHNEYEFDFIGWCYFSVVTAAQVVLDENELAKTTLRFFFEGRKKPVVIGSKISIVKVNIQRDTCILNCFTCDQKLVNKLKMLIGSYSAAREKVYEKYNESREVDKLNFIVSYPHGCSKQVSFGHWVDKYEFGECSQFTYTTCTCPGSSGATVHFLGYRAGIENETQLVHSGSLDCRLNYSGKGVVW